MMAESQRVTFSGDLAELLRMPPALKAWLSQQAYFEEVISKRTPPEGDFFVNQTIQDGEIYAGKRPSHYIYGGGVD